MVSRENRSLGVPPHRAAARRLGRRRILSSRLQLLPEPDLEGWRLRRLLQLPPSCNEWYLLEFDRDFTPVLSRQHPTSPRDRTLSHLSTHSGDKGKRSVRSSIHRPPRRASDSRGSALVPFRSLGRCQQLHSLRAGVSVHRIALSVYLSSRHDNLGGVGV